MQCITCVRQVESDITPKLPMRGKLLQKLTIRGKILALYLLQSVGNPKLILQKLLLHQKIRGI